MAWTKANLAYQKARTHVAFTNRFARNKWLYFIGCGDAVKIGISSDPESRLETIAVGAPGQLCLLAKIANAGQQEADCHKRLDHLRIHGEWFWHTEEVDALIRELRAGHE
jgi:hypothetical protein